MKKFTVFEKGVEQTDGNELGSMIFTQDVKDSEVLNAMYMTIPKVFHAMNTTMDITLVSRDLFMVDEPYPEFKNPDDLLQMCRH